MKLLRLCACGAFLFSIAAFGLQADTGTCSANQSTHSSTAPGKEKPKKEKKHKKTDAATTTTASATTTTTTSTVSK